MTPEQMEQLRSLRGLVATCVTTGTVDPDYAAAREEMRVWNVQHGFDAVEYRTFYCVLVEAGRDEVARHALAEGYDWVLQIDADAAPFVPDALLRLLRRAYVERPEADAVGAYCQLKQAPYLPTIDTGTGTWEAHFPGAGLLPVIRTGGHFLLTKTRAYERIAARAGGASFHRTRTTPAALDAMLEFDNLARVALDGANPFAQLPEWERVTEHARARGPASGSVGEDSGFCDNLLAAGGRLYVDTDLVVGHVARVVVTPEMLKEQLDRRATQIRALCGVGG